LGGGAATATLTAGKVCAVVCSVVVTAGGAVQVEQQIVGDGGHSAPASSEPASVERVLPAQAAAAAAERVNPPLAEVVKQKDAVKLSPVPPTETADKTEATPATTDAQATDQPVDDSSTTGGTAAPDDPASTDPPPATDGVTSATESSTGTGLTSGTSRTDASTSRSDAGSATTTPPS
jgi:hypothetical protein